VGLAACLALLAAGQPAAAADDRPQVATEQEGGAGAGHAAIDLWSPNGGENLTPGSKVKILWMWIHDPQPVHRIDLQFSPVSCDGDWDRTFYNVVPPFRSNKSKGQLEERSWVLDTETPNTHQGCARIVYTTPSDPGQNLSQTEFTIWNSTRPLAQIDLSLEPENALVPSGAQLTFTARTGLRYRELWLPIFFANVTAKTSAGNLTLNRTHSDTQGAAKFPFTAPRVAEETNISVEVCAEDRWYRPACVRTTLTVVPPGKRVMFLDLDWEPDPPLGGTANNVSASVRNVTHSLPWAKVYLTSSEQGAKFEPPSGTANETGVFNSTWTLPDISVEKTVSVRARAELAGYPEAVRDLKVTVAPRPVPKMAVVPFIEGSGVLDSGVARMHVVVTDAMGFVPGALVSVVDAAGMKVLPASSGTTDSRGEFVADVVPPRLPENESARSFAIKFNVTEPGHLPVETFLYVDVYRDPGAQVRPSASYYGVVVALMAGVVAVSAASILRMRRLPGREPVSGPRAPRGLR
jgi:hypothetical protein